MDKRQMVLTAIGPDRPGLVREIAAVIHEAGANLEDSRMAILAGDFALLVLFSGEEASLRRVENHARELEERLGFPVRLKEASQPRGGPEHRTFDLEATGVDRPGIVHRLSRVLTGLEVNVASLESRLAPAAFHGTPMFQLRAELQVPIGADPDVLHEQLEAVCRELQLTLDLTRRTSEPG